MFFFGNTTIDAVLSRRVRQSDARMFLTGAASLFDLTGGSQIPLDEIRVLTHGSLPPSAVMAGSYQRVLKDYLRTVNNIVESNEAEELPSPEADW